MGLQRFMMGRYGTDKLNSLLLWIAVIFVLLSVFLQNPVLNLVAVLAAYGLMGVVIFRSLSRNTYRRHRENRRYLNLLERLKDREHKYFACPKCKQSVRVPKGKGKIAITCPKCREKFVKKT
ncbi:MAG: hypothetical protein E7438_04725 [Ruminococcaceae bacterium]|nr:hypothetical protein [Oscillospiraceae bacterium]